MEAPNPEEAAVFDAALELADAGERKAFLDRVCGRRPAFRARLEKFIAAHEKAEKFFQDCDSALRVPVKMPAGEGASDTAVWSEEQPGKFIGRYQLLEKIGEGGCGVVYLAEQAKPVHRRVALKIIKLGMDTKSVIARFEAERQALAMMDHPNIARVLDAAATGTGRPYFVMELVRGLKITEYCDRNNLDIRQRLDLFMHVCHAIQHAHQKGIIHRDIKPSNILVTLQDGVPVPKVIDFGIAKAIKERLTDKTLLTSHTQIIGTPAYMSPEQAEMNGLDVDTRSDIYSLGVLLYELLTGKTPFDQKILLASGLDEMRRMLRETEPRRPSVKLETLTGAEQAATAAHRRAEPAKLPSLLRGDLDWIVMKALEKDRARRYETANGLAMDIQRHLNNEPVSARPPSRIYRFQKLVRRNRGVFIAAGTVLLALLIGLGTSTWLFVKEREAERQQARLRHESENREKITHAALLTSQGRLEDADQLAAAISFDQPSLESAAVLRSLGEWHALQGRWPPAAGYFQRLLLVDQLDGWDVLTLDYLGCAAVLAQLGDAGKYENFRQDTITRFSATSNPLVAERIIRASLLLPADKKSLGSLAALARVAMPGSARSIRTPLPPGVVWRRNASGSISADAARMANSGVPENSGRGTAGTDPAVAPPTELAGQALAGACSFDGISLGIEFAEPVDMASATNRANYSVNGTTVTGVTAGENEKSVVLWLATPLAGDFSITVKEVKNSNGHLLAGSSIGGTILNLKLHDLATGQPCSVSYVGGGARVVGGGENIWEKKDHFVYVFTKITGDFDYRLRIHSLSPDAEIYARAGLMARDSFSDPGSREVMVGVNAENTFQALMRTATGGEATSQPPNPLPPAGGSNSWVRLQRLGSVFHCYTGTNGIEWTELNQFDSASGAEGPFADPIYLGIAVSSHQTNATITALVSDLGINPDVNVLLPAALLEYRLGNYRKATEWSRRCLSYPQYDPARIAAAHILLAMCSHQLHRDDDALTNLLQGREQVEQRFHADLGIGGGTQGYWFDWISVRMLLQEATALIETPPIPSSH
jgi:serine/threonine protein kinase